MLQRLLLPLAAAVLALVSTALLARSAYPLGPGTVLIEARPSLNGSTVASLPPLGSVEADTHRAPLRLELSPLSVNPADAQRLVQSQPSQQEVVDGLRRELGMALRDFAWQMGGAGLIGGLLTAALFRTRSTSSFVTALGTGTLVPLLLYGAAFAGYDAGAFRQPALKGALSRTPELLGPVNEFGQRFNQLRTELAEVGAVTFSLYQVLATQSPVPTDAIRVLHISDLHLNPVGFDVALQVARRFDVSLVIDSGDLTAEGTEMEAAFAQRIGEFPVPYLFVRGNHDSETTAEAVAAQPNARVLDGDSTTVAGLSVFGIGDPLFTPDKRVERPTTEEQAQRKREFASTVAERLDALDHVPDVVVVHDRLIGGQITGRVPLILFGHGHRFESLQEDGTRLLGVASTGAAGLRSLAPDSGATVGLQVLYFEPEARSLVAYDRVEVRGPQQQFSLRRSLVDTADGPESPEPTPSAARE